MNEKDIIDNIFNDILNNKITDVNTFITSYLDIKEIPSPHKNQIMGIEPINEGEIIKVLIDTENSAHQILTIFTNIIIKFKNKLFDIEYTGKTNKKDVLIFWPFNKNLKSVVFDSAISHYFIQAFGSNYHKAKIKPYKDKLKKFINRNYLDEKEHKDELRKKWAFRFSIFAVIISVISVINSIHPFIESTKPRDTKIINPLSINDTLKIQIINLPNDKIIVDSTKNIISKKDVKTEKLKKQFLQHKQNKKK